MIGNLIDPVAIIASVILAIAIGDVMSVLSTAAIVMGGIAALAKWLWRRFDESINSKLDDILTQTKRTNGRVTVLEAKIGSAEHRITRVEGILIGQGKFLPEDD